MGIIDLLLKRKKETEDASREYNTEGKDDLQAELERREAEADKRARRYPKPEDKK